MTTASLSNTPTEISSTHHAQLAALLQDAGIAPLQLGWIRITGDDRVRWLNGMATNSVQGLEPGQGAYNFFLNAQGRIQGDGYIFATPDALLIETAQAATLVPYLDHYIIMDDVELADITSSRHGITLIGPESPKLLAQLGLAADNLPEPGMTTLTRNDATVTIIRSHSPLAPRFELWCETVEAASPLLSELKEAGAVPVESAALESLRILEGTPLYGIDIRDRDLPQETNQTRALHFSKGCYLGQEIVERIRSRGSVHRTFTAFRLEGTPPAPGTALESAGKPAGELTSIITLVDVQEQSVPFALGYARREALERHEPLSYAGGIAHPISIPAAVEIKPPR